MLVLFQGGGEYARYAFVPVGLIDRERLKTCISLKYFAEERKIFIGLIHLDSERTHADASFEQTAQANCGFFLYFGNVEIKMGDG